MTDYEKIVEQIAKDICKENTICTCKEKDGHCMSIITIAKRLAKLGYKPPSYLKEDYND